MNMRLTPSDLIFVLAICFLLGPWMLFDHPGWLGYASVCVGAVLAGISRADSLSEMLGRGNPGDEFLRDSWLRFKIWLSKRKQK